MSLKFYISETVWYTTEPTTPLRRQDDTKFFWKRMIYSSRRTAMGNSIPFHQWLNLSAGGLLPFDSLRELQIKRRL